MENVNKPCKNMEQSDASLLSPRSSTTRTHSSIGNIKQFEQICFVCSEISPRDFNAYNESELGVCEKV